MFLSSKIKPLSCVYQQKSRFKKERSRLIMFGIGATGHTTDMEILSYPFSSTLNRNLSLQKPNWNVNLEGYKNWSENLISSNRKGLLQQMSPHIKGGDPKRISKGN